MAYPSTSTGGEKGGGAVVRVRGGATDCAKEEEKAACRRRERHMAEGGVADSVERAGLGFALGRMGEMWSVGAETGGECGCGRLTVGNGCEGEGMRRAGATIIRRGERAGWTHGRARREGRPSFCLNFVPFGSRDRYKYHCLSLK